ncbi:MAG: discoidin domain-containing protein, partial [Ignavibacteriaceae bacterium]|nr:discoidin domain-containing protein [Ignavibacteriaceae bacterium]
MKYCYNLLMILKIPFLSSIHITSMNIRLLSLIMLFGALAPSTISNAQNFLIDTTFNQPGTFDSSKTTFVEYNSEPGILKLKSGENENLAKGKFAYVYYTAIPPTDTASSNPFKLIDGKTSTFLTFLPATGTQPGSGSFIVIDLNAFRTVKKVRIVPFGPNPNLRPRAYTVYVGTDTLTFEKVYENPSTIDTFQVAVFNPVVAKYIKIVIDVMATNYNTAISEIEVYGEGYLPAGNYFSTVRDFGKKVNIGSFEFTGDVPQGTFATFSFRTGANNKVDSTWGSWSAAKGVSNSQFDVFEPRQYIQYQINLVTNNLLSPKIDDIKINYDTNNVVSDVITQINPQYVPILKEASFTLSIDAQFKPNDYGIDSLIIATPSPSKLNSVMVNGTPASVLSSVTAKELRIYFPSTVKTSSKIDINITTTPFLNINPFIVKAVSNNVVNNYQQLDSPIKNGVQGWSIVTTGVPDKLIANSKVEPNPFTPNGDGINDVTKITFFLGNIGEPKELIGSQARNVTIKIFDLTGRVIKNLIDQNSASAAYVAENSIIWDGRDENGKIVRPGVYIYQIFVDSDNGGEHLSKTVVVSY